MRLEELELRRRGRGLNFFEGHVMKPFFLIFLVFFAVSGAQAQVYDLPLDSLSEWTGKKSIRVVSNIDGLSADKEFLALLGRLNIKGFVYCPLPEISRSCPHTTAISGFESESD